MADPRSTPDEEPNAFRDARRAAGLTQVAAAKALNVRPATVIAWETGGHAPRPAMLERVAELYGVDTASLERTPAAVQPLSDRPRRSPEYYLGVITAATRMLDRAEGIAGELRGMISDAASELHGVLGQESEWLARGNVSMTAASESDAEEVRRTVDKVNAAITEGTTKPPTRRSRRDAA